ncbi:MAG: helix-turn-helix domain-containing protein, partial [Monoglobaceae bacterium]
MNCIDSKQLSENIKNLRKYFGESQEELAAAVGAGEKTAVSNYERCVHMPKRDVIFAIAKHYRITADDLIYKKFDDLTPIPDKEFGDAEYIKQEISKLFPTIISESALKQNEFAKAHTLQEKI